MDMQDSRGDAVPPHRLLRCLLMAKLTLFAEVDVADVFSSFWNHLLQNMPDRPLEEALRSLFTISLEERLTCDRCPPPKLRPPRPLVPPTPGFSLQISQKVDSGDDSSVSLCDNDALPVLLSPCCQERALWRYFRYQDSYEEENVCPKCGEDSRATKVTLLRSLPRTFTVHLTRLCKTRSQIQKINRTVTFPPTLDLMEILGPEHLPEDEQPTTHCTYRLFAVISHSGTATFGHFSSYIRSCRDGGWYFFNDSCVCKVSWDDVKSTYGNTAFHWGSTASLLIYVHSDVNPVTSGSGAPP
ncbi:unnamed protein product [Ranitomeya imitator]|uniref:USP domain-containing protein n=1 Tax=Ranitomeya imitator TaxID=111125 RepID=A0ABN9L7T9_9NEOB|nr:unnamed protein product [Ranitomeya imitator]